MQLSTPDCSVFYFVVAFNCFNFFIYFTLYSQAITIIHRRMDVAGNCYVQVFVGHFYIGFYSFWNRFIFKFIVITKVAIFQVRSKIMITSVISIDSLQFNVDKCFSNNLLVVIFYNLLLLSLHSHKNLFFCVPKQINYILLRWFLLFS